MMTFMISMALMLSMTLVVPIMLLMMRFFENLLVFWAQILLLLMPAMVLALVLAVMLSLMGVFLSRRCQHANLVDSLTGVSHGRHYAMSLDSMSYI